MANTNILTAQDSSFEDSGTGNWVAGSNVTIARSTALASHGTASLKLTATAAANMYTHIAGGTILVSGGLKYTFLAELRAVATGRNCDIGYQWYDASGVSIGSVVWTSIGTDAVGSWLAGSVVGVTSPSNAKSVRFLVNVTSPAIGEEHHLDKAKVVQGTSTVWTLGGLLVLDDLEYQYESDGVLLNGSNATLPFYDVESIEGLDSPDMDPAIHDKDGGHGSYIFAKFFKHRVIAMETTIYGTIATLDTLLQGLKNNYAPSDDVRPFYIKQPGSAQKILFARSTGVKYKITNGYNLGIMPCQIILLADDPRFYDEETSTAITVAAASALGRTYPKTYPFNYAPTNVGGTTSITNAGDMISFPVYVISGQLSTVKITNTTTGDYIEYQGTVASGTTLTIDTGNMTVVSSTGGTPIKDIVSSSNWPTLSPGLNNFTVAAAAVSGGSVTVKWRSAYS